MAESDTRPTPGPWRAGYYSSIVGLPVMAQPDPAENSIVVATLVGDRAECEANARLIAASPELYGALDRLVMVADSGSDFTPRQVSEILHSARALLLRVATSPERATKSEEG